MDAQIERTLRKEFGKAEGVRGVEKVFIETNLRDTIRNGIYETTTFQQITDQSKIIQSKLQGQYSQDKKHGPWSYLYENYSMKVDSIVNRKPIIHLDGNVRSLKLNFTGGEPRNIWVAKLDSIRRDTLFQTNLFASMNWDSLSFSFVDKSVPRLKTVDGYITQDGFMNGTWKMEYDNEGLKFEETREYIQGFMVGYSLKELSSGILIEEEVFNEIFTLIERSMNETTTPSSFGIDTFTIEDINKVHLASSRQMNFKNADEWIQAAHQLMFMPYIPGGKKVDIGAAGYFRTRMFKRNRSSAQLDSLNKLQTVNLPAIKNSIKNLLQDKLLQENRSQNDSISMIFARLELLDRQIENMHRGLEGMKSDSFRVVSVRPVHHIPGFNTTLQQLNDEEEVLLYTFSSPTKPRRSHIHFVTMYIDEAAVLVAREQDKLANIKQRIMDLEMLVDLEGRIKQEVNSVRAIYNAYADQSSTTEEELSGFEALRLIGAYMNAEFAHRQLDARLSQMDSANEVSQREAIGIATLDYLTTLKAQAEEYNQMSARALSLDRLYSNQKGKREYKHVYSNGEIIWNIRMQEVLKEQDWQTFRAKFVQSHTFIRAMETVAQRDANFKKSLNKVVRRTKEPQEAEQLILSAGTRD